MLLALQTAIRTLLETSLPALFTGAGAVQIAFVDDTWTFDPLSADPVAGEPGPEDAVDLLAFNPAACRSHRHPPRKTRQLCAAFDAPTAVYPADVFISTRPLTINMAAMTRLTLTASPSRATPTTKAPTAPIPVQTA